MTPAQLRILKTLPKVIEAVRALQAESNELMGLLGERAPVVVPNMRIVADPAMPPGTMRLGPGADGRSVTITDVGMPPAQAEAEARAAAEAELARRQAEATPEQKEAEAFLRSQEAPRRSLLNAALGITP